MSRCQIVSLLLATLLCALLPSTDASCPNGKIDNFAFCCCKKIFVPTATTTTTTTIMPSTSFTLSVNETTTIYSSTDTAAASSTSIQPTPTSSYSMIVSSMSAASSSIVNNTISNVSSVLSTVNTTTTPFLSSSVFATPTPIYRGDGCFITEQKYGFYNECYCNYTRYKYEGFNNSNGYYTTNPNATNYEYKCWNLPKPKLYIGGLIDTGPELGKKMLIAADLALEEINKNDGVLPGYELVLLRQNSTKVRPCSSPFFPKFQEQTA